VNELDRSPELVLSVTGPPQSTPAPWLRLTIFNRLLNATRRLAREIHDDLGGYLVATAMDMRRLSDYSPVTTKVSRACLKESRTL
jgi:Ribonuclease G/E